MSQKMMEKGVVIRFAKGAVIPAFASCLCFVFSETRHMQPHVLMRRPSHIIIPRLLLLKLLYEVLALLPAELASANM